jgi:NAD(P)-dependent dehydrogenase (short-subunit alcohol dehydrogenase family)
MRNLSIWQYTVRFMFSPDLLAGKTAIITGGGTGLGLAMATKFATLGANVVLASRSDAHLSSGAAAVRQAAPRAGVLTVATDVRKPEDVDRMVAEASAQFGRIDILINNAAGNFICKAEDLSPNGWNSVINIVLNGSFYCSRAVGRHMIAHGAGGSIVSIVATYAWTGSAGTVHSAAAKAGVMAMTQTLAVEWARHKIRVNAVAPGPIESPGAARQLWASDEAVEKITAMVPLKRWGKPEEIADAVTFLVAPESGYITGDVLTVDGGTWMGRGPFGFMS